MDLKVHWNERMFEYEIEQFSLCKIMWWKPDLWGI